jgi:putative transposase
MCKLLNISRSSLYYAKNKPAKKYNAEEEKLTQHIKEIFKNSRNNYGSRKIKVELKKKGIIASKRRIRRIMKENGLVSTYTVKQYKVHKQTYNNDKIDNKLKRNFNQEERMKVIVSDLTYVNVAGKWNYICLMLDLYNREIVGYAAGKHKDAGLVRKAITTIKYDLNKIEIFHTDRGNEFKNNIIDEVLDTFKIDRSLSAKGCPYDNAVAEATYKIIKTEFAFNRIFDDFEELEIELFDYVNWYNNIRIHGSLGYKTPIEYRAFS